MGCYYWSVAIIPVLVLSKFYITLQELIALPNMVLQIDLNSITGSIVEKSLSGISETVISKKKNTKFTDIFSMGRQLLELKSLFEYVPDVSASFKNVLIISNPMFAIGVIISTIVVILMLIISIFTGLVFLF